jgi:hypothetical protein
MGDQFSKPTFRGLLIPDSRINSDNIESSTSSFSQAGPRVGIPVPQADTNLNLEASGTQSADKQLQIATQKSGYPGLGGATFRWKEGTDSATSWRGSWPASTMADWRLIELGNPSAGMGATKKAIDPDAVLMDDGRIGLVYHRVVNVLGSDQHRVSFRTIDADGTVSSATDLYNRLTTPTQDLHPCIMKLPNGRLMVYHYLEDLGQDTVQVQAWTSTDHGANWTLANDACLDVAIDVSSATAAYDLGERPAAKMRVAYSGGQTLLLIAHRANDTSGTFVQGFHQFASANQGLSFETVEVWDLESIGTQQSIVPSSNGFEVFFIGRDVGPIDMTFRKSLSSAYIPLSTATSFEGPKSLLDGSFTCGQFVTDEFADAEQEVVLGDDGVLYVLQRARFISSSYVTNLLIAADVSGGSERTSLYRNLGQGTGGAAASADNTGMIWYGEDTEDTPKNLGLVAAHGRIAMFHNWNASTGTRDDSLAVAFLGGYNDVTLGNYREDGSFARQVCWDHMYLPIELPNNFSGWTATGTGTVSVDNGYLSVSTSSAAQRYTKTPPGTINEGIICHFGVQHISQTPALSDLVFVRLTQADGSDKYTADIIIRGASVKVEDNNGGTLKGSLSIDTQATNGVEVLAFFQGGTISVFARLRDGAADKQWSTVCSNASISDSGTGTSEVRFGHTAASTAESRWFFLNYVSDEYAGGVDSASGFTNPDDLQGKMYNAIGSTYVDDGVRIRGIDGPTIAGDSFNIDTRYDYGIEKILHGSEPSPAKGWRSTNTSAQEIVFAFQGPNDYATVGLFLKGCNWKTGSLQGWNGSAWVSLATIDTSTGQTGLAYLRSGNGVTVNTGATTAPGRYLQMGELVGGTVDLGSSKYRRITKNTAGVWTNTAGHVLPSIEFDGLDSSEPASGTLDIWNPQILVVMHNVSRIFTKLKLVIDSQTTADGDLRIGQAIIGGLELFSQDYSYGRVIASKPNTDLVTYRDGSRSSFKRADNRRSVSFGWGEGVDVTDLQGSSVDADYLMGTSTSGASPVGYRGDMPSRMLQMLAHTAGPDVPVVYVARVEAGSTGNDVKTILGHSGAIYGRIVSGVNIDNIVGDENDSVTGEVFRIANVQIEEEL